MAHIYVVSAFCKDGAGGNRAGVVLDQPELTDERKMKISKLLGYSETAFITHSDRADYKIEYFTPAEEVPLCGHATIAAFSMMKRLGRLRGERFTIETKAGVLSVTVSGDGMVMMQQNAPEFYECVGGPEIADCLGIPEKETDGPSQIISTGLRDIIVPVRSVDILHGIKPDFEAMWELSREKKVVGLHVFAPAEGDIDAICRNFAPLYGINEESATGTSSCALAAYLAEYRQKKETYIFEQGYALGLPSRITVKAVCDGERIGEIYVGGYGCPVEERDI